MRNTRLMQCKSVIAGLDKLCEEYKSAGLSEDDEVYMDIVKDIRSYDSLMGGDLFDAVSAYLKTLPQYANTAPEELDLEMQDISYCEEGAVIGLLVLHKPLTCFIAAEYFRSRA